MTFRAEWDFDLAGVSTYAIAGSTDKAATYATITSIPNNKGGANYNKKTQKFFYEWSAATPGDVLRVIAQNASLEEMGRAYFVVPAPRLSQCIVMGYVADGQGYVDREQSIIAETEQQMTAPWGPDRLSLSNNAVLAQPSRQEMFPDANGMWQVSLARGLTVRFYSPFYGLDLVVQVPDREGPVNLFDLPVIRSMEGPGPVISVIG